MLNANTSGFGAGNPFAGANVSGLGGLPAGMQPGAAGLQGGLPGARLQQPGMGPMPGAAGGQQQPMRAVPGMPPTSMLQQLGQFQAAQAASANQAQAAAAAAVAARAAAASSGISPLAGLPGGLAGQVAARQAAAGAMGLGAQVQGPGALAAARSVAAGGLTPLPVANGAAARAQLMQAAGLNLAAAAGNAGPLRSAGGGGGLGLLQPGLGGGGGGGMPGDANPLLAMIQKAQQSGAGGFPLGAGLQGQLGGPMGAPGGPQGPFAAALSQQAAANLTARIAAAQQQQQQQQQAGGLLGGPGGPITDDGPAFDPSDFPSLNPAAQRPQKAGPSAEGYAAAITQGLQQVSKSQAPPDFNSDEFPALGMTAGDPQGQPGGRGIDSALLAALGSGSAPGPGLEQLLRAQQAQQMQQLRAAAAAGGQPQGGGGYPAGMLASLGGPQSGKGPQSQGQGQGQVSQGGGSSGQSSGDRFGILGLMTVPRLNDSDLSMLAVGIDLTTLGLNLSAPDEVLLSRTFSSPWFGDAASGSGSALLRLPSSYLQVLPQRLAPGCFVAVKAVEVLFYIFYAMPSDEAQLYAADELCARGWHWHKELRQWFSRAPGAEPSAKGDGFEVGSYLFFDPDRWETQRKDQTRIVYAAVERPPGLPRPTPGAGGQGTAQA